MYGLFNIPFSVRPGALDEPLNKQISNHPTFLCLRPLIHKKSPVEPSSDQIRDFQEIDIQVLSGIELLKPNENGIIDLWIKSNIEGEIPVKFILKYTDCLDRWYQEEKKLWIIFGEIKEKPVSPEDFPDKPSHPSTFPVELNKLYTDPSLIGKGGFARVFKAVRKDGKVVAVKIPQTLDEATGRSFVKDIAAWPNLIHDNIVSFFDANILPIPYLELEYVDGGSLAELPKPVEIIQACKIVFYIAEGLKYAHNQGILHRDLKPHNIMLTKDLVPKITDWGMSKVIAKCKTTTVGGGGCTPKYAAPEQIAQKQFGKTDARTDIYQLGITFYELVTGKLPFDGESFIEISSAIVNDPPELPSSLNPEAKPVENIVLKCIAKNPSQRYQNADELQKELAKYLKLEFKRSFDKSSEKNDFTKARFFLADLVWFTLRQKDYTEVLKYLSILKDFVKVEEKTEIINSIDELDFKIKGNGEPSEDFVARMKIILYGVQMG